MESLETGSVESDSISGEDLLSPMPGTFYSSPTPDDDPFVSKGDKVKKGQTLCIIEAMKIMNEIESEIDGTILETNVDNGEAVEYNQTLFIIKPS
jgi:acetyl-CoA carboxylase biotin carboxyl carrier protein